MLVATFVHDGPSKCKRLAGRYTPDALHAEFGAGFRHIESVREEYVMPSGARQAFVYCLCRFEPKALNHVAADAKA